MLLAVEGGGFFSSSASGYSKGLTLLLLGQKNEEKPMKVSPWNQYQLVDRESEADIQLASRKNRLVRRCAPFVCFGRAAAGLESQSPLKVGPTQQQDIQPGPLDSEKGKDHILTADLVDDDNNTGKLALKSSLKKPINNVPALVGNANEQEAMCEKDSEVDRRKVQWTDASGGELAQIREFELSEAGGSDDEFDGGNQGTCSCRIM
ncbi:hypothetical protein NMG60_11016937 [Bertholletia excelsa]